MNIKFGKVFQNFEAHVDKLVLGVISVVALALLWLYVLSNPYGQVVDGEKKSPSDIDPYVQGRARALSSKLNETAPPLSSVEQYARTYALMMENTVPDISTEEVIPYPGPRDNVIQEDRLYAVPVIPDMTDVQLARMRGAARVPDQEVSPETPYESVAGSQADVDLVTVSARLDIDTLYNNFQASFMGPRLKSSWKDQRLAKPVFARLQLQRRQEVGPGQWGPWQDVPPMKIETYRQRIMELPFDLNQSQFGVDLWKAQFVEPEVQRQILQPPAYQFTVSRTEWMPPEYLDETLEIMEATKRQERRDELEERRNLNERTNPAGGRRMMNTRPATDRTNTTRGARRNPMGIEMGMEGLALTPRRPRERTVEEVAEEYEQELLDDKGPLKSPDPLLVWAIDDTVEPGQTYQYRIRIGLFNPIAGKDWFASEQVEYKDKIVLWSQFAEPIETVTIPRRFYVFPTNVLAANNGNNTEGAKIEVMKYHLGKWREHEFEVYPGEIIGYEVDITEDEQQNTDTPLMMPQVLGVPGVMATENDGIVDFNTGYTLIDIRNTITWGSRLRPDTLSQLLYFDGASTQILPVGQSNWERSMRDQYRDIQTQIEEEVQRRNPGGMDGVMEGIPMMMPPMIME